MILVPLFRLLNRAYWWIRVRTVDRYHILKLDLKPGLYDTDMLFLYANMALLCDFIENQDPFRWIDWGADPLMAPAKAEALAIHYWWKKVRPARVDPLDGVKRPEIKFITREDGYGTMDYIFKSPEDEAIYDTARAEHYLLVEEWADEDALMLLRLAKISRYLVS